MAKIQQQLVVVSLSRLLRSGESETGSMISEDVLAQLEAVIQEIVGDNVIVEINPELN